MAEPEGEAKKRLYLFLGAGASVGAGVPHTVKMLDRFRESVASDPASSDALSQVETVLKQWVASAPESRQLDTESVLEAISFLVDPREAGSAFVGPVGDKPIPTGERLKDLRRRFLEFIRDKCMVTPSDTGPYEGFRHFLFDYNEILVFTVNYDLVVEQLVSRFNLSYVDGFRLRWDPTVFQQPAALLPKVCIYKLHGSAIWFRTPSLGHLSMPVKSRDVTLIDDTPAVPLMMYPAQKWEYERPFLELLDIFTRTLQDPDCEWLVIVGYSFRDEHLNRVLREALSRNPFLMLVLISPHSEDLYRRSLAAPSFGWKIEPGQTSRPLPESPLTGRVVRIPFAYEKVLDDFAREGLPSIKQAFVAYTDARRRAEKEQSIPWNYVAQRLAEEGFVDLLPDVETRIRVPAAPDTWRVGYLATKAAVFQALGRKEARQFAEETNAILAEWFGPGLVPMWERAGDTFSIGVMADAQNQPNVLTKARHGLMNVPGFLEQFSRIVERYSRYLEGDSRQAWYSGTSMRITRLREYCRDFQANVSFTEYLKLRSAKFNPQTERLAELRQELQVAMVTTSDVGMGRDRPLILQDMLDIIAEIERQYLRELMLLPIPPPSP